MWIRIQNALHIIYEACGTIHTNIYACMYHYTSVHYLHGLHKSIESLSYQMTINNVIWYINHPQSNLSNILWYSLVLTSQSFIKTERSPGWQPWYSLEDKLRRLPWIPGLSPWPPFRLCILYLYLAYWIFYCLERTPNTHAMDVFHILIIYNIDSYDVLYAIQFHKWQSHSFDVIVAII